MADLDRTIEDVGPPDSEPPPFEPPPPIQGNPLEDGWKLSKNNGRLYYNPTPKTRGARVIYRQGAESIAEAIARDQREQQETQRDKRPRSHKRPKMPDAPRGADLKALEETLSEALKAPAMVCASFGDEWAAEHFTKSGPYLARNLILASEHNPWLRRKLEEAATGEDAMMMVVSLVSVGGAAFLYVVPPLIYFFNLPAPRKTYEMFGIPDRKHRQPPPYASDQSPESPETTDTVEFATAA
jgi:hypothetical protein